MRPRGCGVWGRRYLESRPRPHRRVPSQRGRTTWRLEFRFIQKRPNLEGRGAGGRRSGPLRGGGGGVNVRLARGGGAPRFSERFPPSPGLCWTRTSASGAPQVSLRPAAVALTLTSRLLGGNSARVDGPSFRFFPPEETEALQEVGHAGSVVSARRPPRDALPTVPGAGQGRAQLAATLCLREAPGGKPPLFIQENRGAGAGGIFECRSPKPAALRRPQTRRPDSEAD